MNNVAEKVTRIDSDAYESAVAFASEHDLKISRVVSMAVRYFAENVVIKEVDVKAEKFCIGDQVIN
ncbi:hypothetical protein [Streptococcus anginosus]|uniref:hypothetical protein n=1 Tax=Streptococcus anginosus TaxID=1328 RepID=UPI0019575E74|nr:hypothetical protein [Streptococcus anginosus]VTY17498.1 Uncharacterised protein [Streptococcus anginosus]